MLSLNFTSSLQSSKCFEIFRLIVELSCCNVDSKIVGSFPFILKCVVSLDESLIVVLRVKGELSFGNLCVASERCVVFCLVKKAVGEITSSLFGSCLEIFVNLRRK